MRRYGAIVSLGLLLTIGGQTCDIQLLPPPTGEPAGQETPEVPQVAKPTAVIPLSRHYVEVVFDKATGAEADLTSYYSITNPNGAVLAIKSVTTNPDRTRVILGTDEQEEVLYTLKILPALVAPAVAPSVTFNGSIGAEPYLVSAVSLDNVTVLVTYSEPMDGNVGSSSLYRIESPDLNVYSATRGSDTTVLLTTAPQSAARYLLRVRNVSARGNKLIDPNRGSVLFDGISPKDETPPALLGAASLSDTQVLLTFSEPLKDGSADPANFSISPALTISAGVFSTYGTQVLLTTLPQPANVEYTVAASNQVMDKAANAINPDKDSATFTFKGQTQLVDASKLPRVVGAISTGNTGVRVVFSKLMGAGLEDKSNYSITGADTSYLTVVSAKAGTDKSFVDLTTSSQSAGVYTVHVVNVKDVQGNPLASPTGLLSPPEGVDPAAAKFNGIPPASAGQQVDADGDGLPDSQETQGWFVIVKLSNGGISTYHVTSDSNNADTDGDELPDALEKSLVFDPRKVDTDGDQINDYDEFNVYYTDACSQDSDVDTINDWLEIFFYRTSAILADTDGDQLKDGVEMFERNRNPLVSDLPLPQITVDDVRLDLKVTSSYTDSEGKTQTVSDSTSTSFTQSRSDTLSTSDTTSTESENQFSQKLGAEVSYSAKDGWGGKVTAEAGFGQRRLQGFSSTVNRESAKASQEEYQRSVQKALEVSERREVTRTIDEALIQATVNIRNKSDIAFTITNLEVSVQQQDRRNNRRFRPIATLRPSGASDPLNQPKYNLGPFDPERGPIIFQNVEVFPNLVDDLMREPTGLIFQVVNFDILDEFGRNFVFSSQEVNDRTVGITIDFGDGTVEQYRVATASIFDEFGHPVGISMQRALEILGLALVSDDNPLTVVDPLPAAVRKSYGTRLDSNNIERLVRVRGIQNDLVAVPEAEKRFWALVSSNIDISPDSNFSELQLFAGDDYLVMFTRDIDKDGLFEREEFMYGSDDRSVDTDGDTLGDFFEVRTGWTVSKIPGLPYKTFSDPTRADSDGEGLTDNTEQIYGTDPNRTDTDEDGLSDAAEVSPQGFDIVLFDGDSDDTNDKALFITPYSSWGIIDGGNGTCNTTAAGDDVQVIAVDGSVSVGDVVIGAGPNGVLDTTPGGDDLAQIAEEIVNGAGDKCETVATGDDIQVVAIDAVTAQGLVLIRAGLNGVIDTTPGGDDYIQVKHTGLFTTDPLNRDTDGDGISDGREILVGTNPNTRDAGNIIDSDGDGLYDAEEDNGWDVIVYGSNGTPTTKHVTGNKFRADTDLDGLPDVYERAIKSDPRFADTDADGLLDRDEFDPDDADHYYNVAALEQAVQRCGTSPACTTPDAPDPSQRLRTNVFKKDSDSDGRDDNVELATPWTVDLFGAPYLAYSKPYSADFDNDSLTDAQELTNKTDPNKADTDEDGVSGLNGTDSYEISVGRNPLRKDQKITFTYTTVDVIDNCEGASGTSGEFYGNLYLTYPGSSTQTNVYACSNCCQVNDFGSCTKNVSNSFVIYQGQSFTAASDNWYEDDGSCGPACDPEQVGSFSQAFPYPVAATSSTFNLSGPDRCINISYSITTK